MGQIFHSSAKKDELSIDGQLGNPSTPMNTKDFGIFTPTVEKISQNKAVNGWVVSSKLEDRRVGGADIKLVANKSLELENFGIENVRKLRQLNFSPDQTLQYIELLGGLDSFGFDDVLKLTQMGFSPSGVLRYMELQATKKESGVEISYKKKPSEYTISEIPASNDSSFEKEKMANYSKDSLIVVNNPQLKEGAVVTVLKPKTVIRPMGQVTQKRVSDITRRFVSLPEKKVEENIQSVNNPKEEVSVINTENDKKNKVTVKEKNPLIPPNSTPLKEEIRKSFDNLSFVQRMNGGITKKETAPLLEKEISSLPPTNITETTSNSKEKEVASLEDSKKYDNLKHLAATKIANTLSSYYGDDWSKYLMFSGENSKKTKTPEKKDIILSSVWGKNLNEETAVFCGDFTMSEKDLITKYIPSYVNQDNPLLWVSVIDFSADKILNGQGVVYRITHDTRLEVSTLLKYLGAIDEAIDSSQLVKRYENNKFSGYEEYLSNNPKLTIHEYYEDIRKRVTEANKNEYK